MTIGLIGKKLGMTREFFESGISVPVTVIKVEKGRIIDLIDQNKRGNATVISAMVPLANMFGYINNLRSMTQGRASYSMFFDHYEKVPQNVQDEVTKKLA